MATHSDHIEILARALITRSGSILLCQNLKEGYFYLPGGHVEPGESSAEACKRELQEELGLCAQVGICRLIAEQRFEQGGKMRHEINLVFHVEHLSDQTCAPHNPCRDSSQTTDQAESAECAQTSIPGDLEIKSAEDHIGFEWIKIAELGSIDLRPAIIRDWIIDSGEGDSLRFLTG